MNAPSLRVVGPDDLPAPRVDDLSALILDEAIEALAKVRTHAWLGDSAVHLHALASLIAQAQQTLPDAIADARDQDYTWTEISQLLNLTPTTTRRRYRNH
jgi:hypothetical protein